MKEKKSNKCSNCFKVIAGGVILCATCYFSSPHGDNHLPHIDQPHYPTAPLNYIGLETAATSSIGGKNPNVFFTRGTD